MIPKTTLIAVGTAATRLDASDQTPETVAVYNDGSSNIYVGGPDVTTANGFPVVPGNWITIDLETGATFYGIVATGTVNARVMSS